jgi:hypothetical protein
MRPTGSDRSETAGGPCHVSLYGLRVQSDIDLPGWPRIAPGAPDLVIRLEPFDAATFEAQRYWTSTRYDEGDVRLEIRDVGKYIATGGTEIRVAPEPGAKPEDLRLFLTGALMGAILHQRGIYPLHASCVAINGNGVAFAAASGEGKSTLVASMVDRGATFVSDDICVMTRTAEHDACVWPGAARVKLDEKGLAALTSAPTDLEPVGGDRQKFHLPVGSESHWMSPVPLRRVYLLASADGEPRIERITGLDAISALHDQTYFLSYATGMGRNTQVFRLAAEISRSVIVSRLTRPRGLEHMPAVLEMITRDLQTS